MAKWGPWQTSSVCHLNHAAVDSGIPGEAATQRIGITLLFADAASWTHVKAILASRKTARTVPPRSQWKPLLKSVPHFGVLKQPRVLEA
jgi:hypothetical protein